MPQPSRSRRWALGFAVGCLWIGTRMPNWSVDAMDDRSDVRIGMGFSANMAGRVHTCAPSLGWRKPQNDYQRAKSRGRDTSNTSRICTSFARVAKARYQDRVQPPARKYNQFGLCEAWQHYLRLRADVSETRGCHGGRTQRCILARRTIQGLIKMRPDDVYDRAGDILRCDASEPTTDLSEPRMIWCSIPNNCSSST